MAHAYQRLVLAQPLKKLLAQQHRRGIVHEPTVAYVFPVRVDAKRLGLAPREEQHALVAHPVVHAAERLVQDDQVRLLDNGAQEEQYPLRRERSVAETHGVCPVHAVRVAFFYNPLLGIETNGQGGEGRIQLGFKPSQTGVHGDVAFVRQAWRPEESVGPSALQGLAYGKIAGEKGMNLRRGLAYARLDVKNGNTGQSWLWQTTSPKNLDR